MKKILFFLSVSVIYGTVDAQLNNTKWKGTIQLENKIDVVFDYRKDTLAVSNIADNSSLETMTYAIKDSIITLQKIYGQSDCDSTEGKYKFQVKNNLLSMTLLSDACENRSSILNNSKWFKIK